MIQKKREENKKKEKIIVKTTKDFFRSNLFLKYNLCMSHVIYSATNAVSSVTLNLPVVVTHAVVI